MKCDETPIQVGQLNEDMAEIERENDNLTDEVDHHVIKMVELIEQLNERIPCDHCPMTFQTDDTLNEHINDVHVAWKWNDKSKKWDKTLKLKLESPPESPGRIPCDHCPKTFHTEDTLKEHINDEHVAWKWNEKSKKWDKTLKSKLESLPNPEPISDVKIVPKKIEYINGRIPCDQCPKTFQSEYTFRKHIKVVHVSLKNINGRIPCDQCPTTFRNERNYRNHIQVVHVGLKNRKECSTCGKKFQSLYHLKRHQQSVHEGLRFHCNLCERHFSDTRRLKNHIRDDHGSEV